MLESHLGPGHMLGSVTLSILQAERPVRETHESVNLDGLGVSETQDTFIFFPVLLRYNLHIPLYYIPITRLYVHITRLVQHTDLKYVYIAK